MSNLKITIPANEIYVRHKAIEAFVGRRIRVQQPGKYSSEDFSGTLLPFDGGDDLTMPWLILLDDSTEHGTLWAYKVDKLELL